MNRCLPLPFRPLAATLLLACLCVLMASPRLPAEDVSKLAGEWTWTWKDQQGRTHRHRLEVEGIDTKLAARERFDEQPPVKVENLTFDGKKVRFAVVRDERRAEYSGVLDGGDTINGTVIVKTNEASDEFTWKATKEPVKKKDQKAPEPEK